MSKYIGEQFNFYITGDAGTDITDTRVTGMLASQTHNLIFELFLTSKAGKFHSWDNIFLQLLQIDFVARYFNLIKQARIILSENVRVISGTWETKNFNFG